MKIRLLFQKFCITEESKVCILITDTKTVWSEGEFRTQVLLFLHTADIGLIHVEPNLYSCDNTLVLTFKQVLRRWRNCNPDILIAEGKEPNPGVPNLLSLAHTIGAISDASFELVDSTEAVSNLSFFLF